jgi:hypothetical protein
LVGASLVLSNKVLTRISGTDQSGSRLVVTPPCYRAIVLEQLALTTITQPRAEMTSDEAPRWRYERGEGRYKHRWSNDYAGFEPGGKGPVGKCPSSKQAQSSGYLREHKQWLKHYG